MSSAATAMLAMIPPFFAILVERYNPISPSAIHSSVVRDLDQFRTQDATAHQTLVNHVAKLVEGAVEVAGLTPTFVACLTSGFGVLSEYPNPWMITVYILVFLALLLFLLHYLSGQSFLQMVVAEKRIPYPFVSSTLPINVISRTIYVANFILIAFVGVVFFIGECGSDLIALMHKVQH